MKLCPFLQKTIELFNSSARPKISHHSLFLWKFLKERVKHKLTWLKCWLNIIKKLIWFPFKPFLACYCYCTKKTRNPFAVDRLLLFWKRSILALIFLIMTDFCTRYHLKFIYYCLPSGRVESYKSEDIFFIIVCCYVCPYFTIQEILHAGKGCYEGMIVFSILKILDKFISTYVFVDNFCTS